MKYTKDTIEAIRREIVGHESNRGFTDDGIEPLMTAHRDARVVIIGQAPGSRNHAAGKAWIHVSGERLRGWMGVDESTFYDERFFAQLPMDFYYPGKGPSGDLPPRKDFADMWHARLLEAMPHLELFILIGGYAQKYYLADLAKPTLTETTQSFREYLPKHIPLPHPSPRNNIWLAKNKWFERDVVPTLRERVKAVIA